MSNNNSNNNESNHNGNTGNLNSNIIHVQVNTNVQPLSPLGFVSNNTIAANSNNNANNTNNNNNANTNPTPSAVFVTSYSALDPRIVKKARILFDPKQKLKVKIGTVFSILESPSCTGNEAEAVRFLREYDSVIGDLIVEYFMYRMEKVRKLWLGKNIISVVSSSLTGNASGGGANATGSSNMMTNVSSMNGGNVGTGQSGSNSAFNNNASTAQLSNVNQNSSLNPAMLIKDNLASASNASASSVTSSSIFGSKEWAEFIRTISLFRRWMCSVFTPEHIVRGVVGAGGTGTTTVSKATSWKQAILMVLHTLLALGNNVKVRMEGTRMLLTLLKCTLGQGFSLLESGGSAFSMNPTEESESDPIVKEIVVQQGKSNPNPNSTLDYLFQNIAPLGHFGIVLNPFLLNSISNNNNNNNNASNSNGNGNNLNGPLSSPTASAVASPGSSNLGSHALIVVPGTGNVTIEANEMLEDLLSLMESEYPNITPIQLTNTANPSQSSEPSSRIANYNNSLINSLSNLNILYTGKIFEMFKNFYLIRIIEHLNSSYYHYNSSNNSNNNASEGTESPQLLVLVTISKHLFKWMMNEDVQFLNKYYEITSNESSNITINNNNNNNNVSVKFNNQPTANSSNNNNPTNNNSLSASTSPLLSTRRNSPYFINNLLSNPPQSTDSNLLNVNNAGVNTNPVSPVSPPFSSVTASNSGSNPNLHQYQILQNNNSNQQGLFQCDSNIKYLRHYLSTRPDNILLLHQIIRRVFYLPYSQGYLILMTIDMLTRWIQGAVEFINSPSAVTSSSAPRFLLYSTGEVLDIIVGNTVGIGGAGRRKSTSSPNALAPVIVSIDDKNQINDPNTLLDGFIRVYIQFATSIFDGRASLGFGEEQETIYDRTFEFLQFISSTSSSPSSLSALQSPSLFELSWETWIVLMENLLHVCESHLMQPNKYAIIASPSSADDICNTLVTTLLFIWLRFSCTSVNSSNDNDKDLELNEESKKKNLLYWWKLLQDHLSASTRWPNLITIWSRTLISLTHKLASHYYGISCYSNLINLGVPVNGASESIVSRSRRQTPIDSSNSATTANATNNNSGVKISSWKDNVSTTMIIHPTALLGNPLYNLPCLLLYQGGGFTAGGGSLAPLSKTINVNNCVADGLVIIEDDILLESNNSNNSNNSKEMIETRNTCTTTSLISLLLNTNTSAERFMFIWSNMLCVLGNPNRIERPEIYASAMQCLCCVWEILNEIACNLNSPISINAQSKSTLTLTREQSASSPSLPNLFILVPWLLEACYVLGPAFSDGKALAYACLSRLLVSKSNNNPHLNDHSIEGNEALYYVNYYRVLIKALLSGTISSGSGNSGNSNSGNTFTTASTAKEDRVLYSILAHTSNLFNVNLPGCHVLIPAYLSCLERLLLFKKGSIPGPIRQHAIQILQSISITCNQYLNCDFVISLPGGNSNGNSGGNSGEGINSFKEFKAKAISILFNLMIIQQNNYNNYSTFNTNTNGNDSNSGNVGGNSGVNSGVISGDLEDEIMVLNALCIIAFEEIYLPENEKTKEKGKEAATKEKDKNVVDEGNATIADKVDQTTPTSSTHSLRDNTIFESYLSILTENLFFREGKMVSAAIDCLRLFVRGEVLERLHSLSPTCVSMCVEKLTSALLEQFDYYLYEILEGKSLLHSNNVNNSNNNSNSNVVSTLIERVDTICKILNHLEEWAVLSPRSLILGVDRLSRRIFEVLEFSLSGFAQINEHFNGVIIMNSNNGGGNGNSSSNENSSNLPTNSATTNNTGGANGMDFDEYLNSVNNANNSSRLLSSTNGSNNNNVTNSSSLINSSTRRSATMIKVLFKNAFTNNNEDIVGTSLSSVNEDSPLSVGLALEESITSETTATTTTNASNNVNNNLNGTNLLLNSSDAIGQAVLEGVFKIRETAEIVLSHILHSHNYFPSSLGADVFSSLLVEPIITNTNTSGANANAASAAGDDLSALLSLDDETSSSLLVVDQSSVANTLFFALDNSVILSFHQVVQVVKKKKKTKNNNPNQTDSIDNSIDNNENELEEDEFIPHCRVFCRNSTGKYVWDGKEFFEKFNKRNTENDDGEKDDEEKEEESIVVNKENTFLSVNKENTTISVATAAANDDDVHSHDENKENQQPDCSLKQLLRYIGSRYEDCVEAKNEAKLTTPDNINSNNNNNNSLESMKRRFIFQLEQENIPLISKELLLTSPTSTTSENTENNMVNAAGNVNYDEHDDDDDDPYSNTSTLEPSPTVDSFGDHHSMSNYNTNSNTNANAYISSPLAKGSFVVESTSLPNQTEMKKNIFNGAALNNQRPFAACRKFISQMGFLFLLENSFFSSSHQVGSGGFGGRELILLNKTPALLRDIKGLDRKYSRETVKVALLYVGQGDEEESSILGHNMHTTSASYREFVDSLGWPVSLSNGHHQGYSGGLDKSFEQAVYWADSCVEIIFHDASRLESSSSNINNNNNSVNINTVNINNSNSPNTATNTPNTTANTPNTTSNSSNTFNSDPKQIRKKRHIGNDHVHIIWNEHYRDYRPRTIRGDFGNVQIIISPIISNGSLFQVDLYRMTSNNSNSNSNGNSNNSSGGNLSSPLFSRATVTRSTLPHLVRCTALCAHRLATASLPNTLINLKNKNPNPNPNPSANNQASMSNAPVPSLMSTFYEHPYQQRKRDILTIIKRHSNNNTGNNSNNNNNNGVSFEQLLHSMMT